MNFFDKNLFGIFINVNDFILENLLNFMFILFFIFCSDEFDLERFLFVMLYKGVLKFNFFINLKDIIFLFFLYLVIWVNEILGLFFLFLLLWLLIGNSNVVLNLIGRNLYIVFLILKYFLIFLIFWFLLKFIKIFILFLLIIFLDLLRSLLCNFKVFLYVWLSCKWSFFILFIILVYFLIIFFIVILLMLIFYLVL